MKKIELTRRSAMTVLGATLLSPYNASSQVLLRPAKLLIVRRPAFNLANNCTVPCIRGHIYDVSEFDLFSDVSLPALITRTPICDTIERPWKNNKPNVSAIEVGKYDAYIRADVGKYENGTEKKWMKKSLNHRWRIQLIGTKNRTAIQLHYGLDEKWSEGCFIVGKHISKTDNGITEKYCKLSNPTRAIRSIRNAVTGSGIDRNQKIQIGVADYNGLFPNFSTTSC